MSQCAELLFVNEAFYHAFQTRDVAAMEALWARHVPVVCIHPGWRAMATRDEIMASWHGILTSPDAPDIACCGANGRLVGGVGVVVCYEQMDDRVLVATNLYIREEGAWKLIHHQAGPSNLTPGEVTDDPVGGRLQ
ncbi:MAG: DUF4440 domain-containing protein [Alphaproteobacteria bacterium]|nr:MAG: DUF4440 domain-containing protein [Alphaproteobacteria bacterium]